MFLMRKVVYLGFVLLSHLEYSALLLVVFDGQIFNHPVLH
jgi:hypothetical protein